jgi:WD40 repeat protein
MRPALAVSAPLGNFRSDFARSASHDSIPGQGLVGQGRVPLLGVRRVTAAPKIMSGGFVGPPPEWSAIGASGVVAGVSAVEIDGRPHAITAGKTDDTVRIWDLMSCTKVGQLDGHAAGVNAVAVATVDGRPLCVSVSDDSTVRIWNLATRTETGQLPDHGWTVHAVTITNVDGKPVAVTSGGDPPAARIFDLVRHRKIGQFAGGSASVKAISTANVNGQPVAVALDTDDKVRIWSLRTGAAIGELTHGVAPIAAVCATTVNGDSLAITAGIYSPLWAWDLASLEEIGPLPANGQYVEHARAIATTSLNGQPLVVTAHGDGILRLFDLSSRTAIGQLDDHRGAQLNAICATTVNGDPVAITVGEDRAVRVWDLVSRTQIGELVGHTDSVRAVSASAVDGKPIAISAGKDGPPQIWDLNSRTATGRLFGSHGPAKAVCITTASGKPLAITGYDRTVCIGDLTSSTENGDELTRPTELTVPRSVEKISCTTVNGRAVAVSAGIESVVRIFDLTNRSEIGQLVGHGSRTWARALTTTTVNGQPRAITASHDRTVRIWDLETYHEIGRLVGYPDWVEAVASTIVDGQSVAITGGYDGTVRIWDLASYTEINQFLGDSYRVNAVATATVNGQPLAISAGHEGIVRIFDLSASQQMHSFAAHHGPINDLQTYESVDGDHWLLSVGEDGLLRNWLLDQMLKPHSLGIDDIFAGENTGAEDQLARGELVTHLVKRLDQLTTGDRSPSPLAGDMTGSGIIHVDGRWGAGKTTFVELVLRAGWTDNASPVIVRYDAWRQAAIAPEWWSLASEIRRAIHATRAAPTRSVMTIAGFIRRLAVSTSTWVALLSVGALVLAGRWLVSNPGVPQQLEAVLKLLTNITGVLAIVFIVARGLFWAAPVLGRLHALTDDNPLGEISGIVGHLRRWLPREGAHQRLADWLLAGWLLFSVCLAVWWKPLIRGSKHAAAYWHALPATTQTSAVKAFIALAVAIGGVILLGVLWGLLSRFGESGRKHRRRRKKPSTSRYVSPPRLTRRDVIRLIASVVTLLVLGLIGWILIAWLVWPALAAGISRLWALPVDDRWRWIWAFVTLAGLGGYLIFLLVIRHRPRRMVLLIIDDLDRCAADRVVRLLEAIHTLLRERAAPRRFPVWRRPAKFGVLVLANGAWIRAAFRSGYKDFDHGGADAVHDLGADFLHKIFDHSVLVPDLSPEQTHDLMHVVAKSSYWIPATRGPEPLGNGQEEPLAVNVRPGLMPATEQVPAALALTPERNSRTTHKEASSPEAQDPVSKYQPNPSAGTIDPGAAAPRAVDVPKVDGEKEPADDVNHYQTRVKKSQLPAGVRAQALREVGRLERISDQSREADDIRIWLDSILDPRSSTHSVGKAAVDQARIGIAESDLGVNAALLVTHLLTKYSGILPGNPRLIIRVATAWAMLRAVGQSLNLSIEGERATDLLVRAAVVWVRFPVLVDEILDAPEPPIIDSKSPDCTPHWRRRDVQEVLKRAPGC